MPLPVLALTCVKGLSLGLLHALESDHIAAVTTIVTAERGARQAALIGACWGAGHALAVVTLGAILLALRVQMPPPVALLLDGAVVLMLVALGVNALRLTGRRPTHSHETLATPRRTPLRAAVVGLVHGASGTGALALVLLTTLPNRVHGVWYLLLFAFGATVSMTALTALLSLPIRAAVRRWDTTSIRILRLLAGTFSLGTAGVLLVDLTGVLPFH